MNPVTVKNTKLLKPGGYLFITTPNITSWLSRFIFLFTHGGLLPTIWITKYLSVIIPTILSIVFRPFMRGISKGWFIIVIAKKGLSQ
jgi:hypothetical protein